MLINSPKFLADRYRRARPLYPRAIFGALERALSGKESRFLDLACGAGQSTRSFLALDRVRAGAAVDADPEMLATARAELADEYPGLVFRVGRAEAIPLEDASVDLALVGSAIHWFDLSLARGEIARVLRPGGLLFVFEYQFPKCVDDPELAEAARRRFNLEWKAPIQRPRGTLAELLAPFRAADEWADLGEDRPEWIETLALDGFLGHLFSQSRYLHAEAAVADPAAYRESIAADFAPFFASGPLRFDLKPRSITLRKRL